MARRVERRERITTPLQCKTSYDLLSSEVFLQSICTPLSYTRLINWMDRTEATAH